MTDLKTRANEVFRDSVTSGVPATGPNEPSKSEIRALFADISDAIDQVEAGYVAEVQTVGDLPSALNYDLGKRAKVATGNSSQKGVHEVKLVGGVKTWVWTSQLDDVSDLAVRQDALEATTNALNNGINARLASVGAAAASGLTGDGSMTAASGFAASFIAAVAAIVGGTSPNIDTTTALLSMLRASAASYVDANGYIKQVASGAFAVTHDPLSYESIGLHVGPAALNLLTNAGDINSSDWVKTNVTVDTTQFYSGPDGTLSARKVTDSSSSLFGTVAQTKTAIAGLTPTSVVTISFFVKNIDTNAMQFTPSLAGATAVNATVNYNPATRTISSVANCTAEVRQYRDGWSRIDVHITGNGTANTNVIARYRLGTDNVNGLTSVYVGRATAYVGSRYLGSVDSRAADLITLLISKIDWRDNSGTLALDFGAVPANSERVSLLTASAGSGNKRFSIEINSNGSLQGYVSDGSNVVSLTSPNTNDRNGGRAALTWDQSGAVSLVMNGAVVATAAGVTYPAGLTVINIGSDLSGASQPACSIANVFHQPRALSPNDITAAGKRVYSSASGAFSDGEIQAQDAWTVAKTAEVVGKGNLALPAFLPGNNWISEESQSLPLGTSSFPLLSTSFPALTIGNSVRDRLDKDTFIPFLSPGDAGPVLKPAQATVDGIGFDATISNANPAIVTKTGHGLPAGREITFSTTASLPTGIVAGAVYTVLAAGLTADTFQFSAMPGGTPIATTSAGSGTHTVSIPPQSLTAILSFAYNDVITGENLSLNFTKAAKQLWNQSRNVLDDTSRQFVVTSTGKGGSSISDLLDKGGYRWKRTVSAGGLVKSLSDALNVLSYHHLVVFGQGESDYTDGVLWFSKFFALGDQVHTDITVAQLAQQARATWLYYQIGGRWTEDDDDIRVHQAQLAAAINEPTGDYQRNLFCYGPNYYVTNKPDGHLDANGIIWLAEQMAKVWFKIIVMRQGWMPLHARRGLKRKTDALVMYHAPGGDLQWRVSYVGFTPTMFANKGFRIVDSLGDVPILSIGFPDRTSSTVGIKTTREMIGSTFLYYGGETAYGGNGNLFDNDNQKATRNFTAQASAMAGDPTANVAALDGKSYPLNNAACIQKIELVAA